MFKNVCFTVNNWTEEDKAFLVLSENIIYIIYGEEVAPTTGTPHLQCYAQFAKRYAMKTAKRILGPNAANIVAAMGTPEQNRTYCSKDGKFTELGTISKQGQRTDLTGLRKQVDTTPFIELISQCENFQQMKMVEKLFEYKPLSTEFKKKTVYWFYGATGTGKTKAAYELVKSLNKDFYRSSTNGGQWFNGYMGQPIAILDEVRANKWPYALMLELLDGYEVRVPNKGGFHIWNPEVVIITCPRAPEECYAGQLEYGDGHIDQLLRRITDIRHFEQCGPFPVTVQTGIKRPREEPIEIDMDEEELPAKIQTMEDKELEKMDQLLDTTKQYTGSILCKEHGHYFCPKC